MDSIQLVKEFHEVYAHIIASSPVIPSDDTNVFRINFMKEELAELATAAMHKNLVEFADGLGDLQYVLDGWFLNAGLLEYKDAIMAEIHSSNMSKVCETQEIAELTIISLQDLHDPKDEAEPKYHWEKVGQYFIVKRSIDGKVMKSINFRKPDLARILNKKL
jgi:predicted HAD superfamily Cof-like phosphohydrolase